MSQSAKNASNNHRAVATSNLKRSISTLALVALWGTPTYAQQAVPGVDPECLIVDGFAICEGDLAGGVSSQPGSLEFDRLNVRNADAQIALLGILGKGEARNSGDIIVENASGNRKLSGAV